MKTLRLLHPLIASGFLVSSAFADHHDHHENHDHDRDHHDHDWGHHGHFDRGRFGRDFPVVGFYSEPYYRSYYYDDDYFYAPPRRLYAAESYSTLLMDVQSALARRGYYRGVIDGDIGPGSRAAIRGFQRDHDLPVTGRIDTPLRRALRL